MYPRLKKKDEFQMAGTHMQCMIQRGEENATFIYHDKWGTQASKCRDPVKCKRPFDAPLETGLQLVMQNESYFEFGMAKYE